MSSEQERKKRESFRIRHNMDMHRKQKLERERIAYELLRGSKETDTLQLKVCDCGRDKCSLSNKSCCYCLDRRPVHTDNASYIQYMDGIGWVYDATREQFYCPTCKNVYNTMNNVKKEEVVDSLEVSTQ